MDPQSSKSRRLMKDELTKSRQKFVLDTHFDIGYELQRHDTSHGEQFTGRALNDRFVPAAGKSDGVPAASRRFRHLKHSENTQDMRPDYSFLYKQVIGSRFVWGFLIMRPLTGVPNVACRI